MSPSGSVLARAVIVTLSYFVAGSLSLALAIAPGFASPVWPAAGLALAFVLLWGRWMLPAIAAGSFLVNVGAHGSPPSEAAFVAVGIGAGAAAQAALGAALVRRVVPAGNPIESGVAPLKWLFLAGPAACLLNAAWGPVVLGATGTISWADYAFNWATWWTGDTIGTALVAPIVLLFASPRGSAWSEHRAALVAILLGSLVALVALLAAVTLREEERHRARFVEDAQRYAETLQADVRVLEEHARAVGALFEASTHVTREEFGTFVRLAFPRHPATRVVRWAPLVLAGQRAGVESEARQEGDSWFAFTELAADGTYTVAGNRPFYFPILYAESREPGRTWQGLDLAMEPYRLTQHLGGGHDVFATGLVPLLTRAGARPLVPGPAGGILLLVPVRPELLDAGVGLAGPVQRGFVVLVFDPSTWLDASLAASAPFLRRLEVRDTTDDAPETVYLLERESLPAVGRTVFSSTEELEFAGRRWILSMQGCHALPPAAGSWPIRPFAAALSVAFAALSLELAGRRVRVRAMVAARTAELTRSNAALQASNVELQRFAYVVSHDLNEPVRAIRTYADMLIDGGAAEAPEWLRRIAAAATRLQALLADLLDLARVDTREAPFVRVPLRGVVDAALDALRPSIEEAGAVVEVGPLPDVSCDPVQILQLFQNLFSNALKFRREGVPSEIRVTAARVGSGWEICVRDNGRGLEPEHLLRIFDIFQRLHPGEGQGGTGMGLAICRRIVERHGGRIWVESTPGAGSAFHFVLPEGA